MGKLFLVNLEGKSYSCKHCKTNLALCDDVVSKSFQSRHGKASLFSKVLNVYVGKKEDRMMMTGCTPLPIFTVSNAALMLDGDMYKVWDPDGNNYWVAQEVKVVESNTDDA